MWIEIERFQPPRLVGEPGEGCTYEYKRKFIGGNLDRVALAEFQAEDGKYYTIDLWYHDEGLSLDLPQSVIVPGMYPDGSGVRGPAIIDMGNFVGESVSLTEEALEKIQFYRPMAPLIRLEFDRQVEDIGEFPTIPTIRIC